MGAGFVVLWLVGWSRAFVPPSRLVSGRRQLAAAPKEDPSVIIDEAWKEASLEDEDQKDSPKASLAPAANEEEASVPVEKDSATPERAAAPVVEEPASVASSKAEKQPAASETEAAQVTPLVEDTTAPETEAAKEEEEPAASETEAAEATPSVEEKAAAPVTAPIAEGPAEDDKDEPTSEPAEDEEPAVAKKEKSEEVSTEEENVAVADDVLDEEEPAAEVVEKVEESFAKSSSLSESVLADFSERSSRNMEVARLQTQLERSQMRRKQVEEVVGEELEALRGQLDREMDRELERERNVVGLVEELESAALQKKERIETEKMLLVQLQDVAQRTSEEVIKNSVKSAVETKANLVAIEMILVDDIEECLEQVEVELSEIKRRMEAMQTTRDSLPSLDDREALRLFSWSQISQLEDELRRSAVAIAETDAKVASLRERIKDALTQRSSALGNDPLPKEVQTVDLTQLEDYELQQALSSSAMATVGAIGLFAQRCFATFGLFADSQERQNAANLLGEAGNATKSLREELDAAATSADIVPADEIAKSTSQQIQRAGQSFGRAAAAVGTGLAQASEQTDLGQAAFDVVAAASNTVAAASVIAFRAVKDLVPKEAPTKTRK